jgi:hypothetical protein
LLDDKGALVTGTFITPQNTSPTNLQKGDASPVSRSWQTGTRLIPLDKGKQLSIVLDTFESNTPPGDAVVDVLVQVNATTPDLADRSIPRTLKVSKVADAPAESKIHYFTVIPARGDRFLRHKVCPHSSVPE